MGTGFSLRVLPSGDGQIDLAREVRAGLTAARKQLPCRFFYDAAGSRIFEEICALEEYYLTRAEDEILARHAADIVAAVAPTAVLVELGSGAATKTRRLLDAHRRRGGNPGFAMVDISSSALEGSARVLRAEFPALSVEGIAAEYEDGIDLLAAEKRTPWLVLWLGSNVGNLDRDAAGRFLGRVRARLGRDDRFLLGVDRRKEKSVLERAYDDASGVTARFNFNLFTRIDRELGGHFAGAAFRHIALYDEAAGRVEMHLESLVDQVVRVDALELDVRFARGERIHTEDSYKYSDAEVRELGRAAGFRVERTYTDSDARFLSVLFAPE
ncbi:MAG: L-histidine N(alpha)-methyltransferase [Planctomycetota bacterium]|nr:L-histidine N(alpha)-methyltransferase [Planctomycetota bacterium]